jgi:hypothetical protein
MATLAVAVMFVGTRNMTEVHWIGIARLNRVSSAVTSTPYTLCVGSYACHHSQWQKSTDVQSPIVVRTPSGCYLSEASLDPCVASRTQYMIGHA